MKTANTQGPILTLRTFTVFLWVCLIGTAAIAGEEHSARVKSAADGHRDIAEIEHMLEDLNTHETHENCIFRKEQDATN